MKNICLALFVFFSKGLFALQPCQWAYIPVGIGTTSHTLNYTTADAAGNIIQVGRILGVADMDPGSLPTDTSFSPGGYGYYLSKTSISGQLMWIQYFNQPGGGMFEFKGVRVNSNDDIIVIGNFFGVVDFDLSTVGVDTIRSHFPTYPDYFVAKYSAAGNHQWAFGIGNPTTSNIEAESMCIKTNDDIVICANPSGGPPIDVDPGPAVHNTIGGNANVICYNSSGNYVWNNNIATTYSYANDYKSIDCDAAGNIYLLSVGYYELTVSKFDATGIQLWDKTIGNFSSQARVDPQSVLVEKATGNFYVAGTYDGTVDFDPGAAVVNNTSTSNNYQDGFIAKYNSTMNVMWVNPYPGNINFGTSGLDFSGNGIVAVGSLTGTIDFGNGVLFVAPAQVPFYVNLNSNGIAISGHTIAGFGSYTSINAVNNQCNVICGYISGSADMDPTAAVLTLTSPSFTNAFTAVYGTISTSIAEQATSSDIKVFPNPADDFVVIENASAEGAQLFDANGKEVLSQNIFQGFSNKLNIKDVKNGIYFLKSGNSIQKISVLHSVK